jgi:hypothetical protein
VKVFPHAMLFGTIAVGSDRPIPYDPHTIRQRMHTSFTQSYYATGGVDLESVIEPYLSSPPTVFGPDFDRAALTNLNRDLFPKDEFMVR